MYHPVDLQNLEIGHNFYKYFAFISSLLVTPRPHLPFNWRTPAVDFLPYLWMFLHFHEYVQKSMDERTPRAVYNTLC